MAFYKKINHFHKQLILSNKICICMSFIFQKNDHV